ncbi:MAG: hypothetical protein ACJ8FU_16000 [Xanthobacteraceae bacterium]|jgi:hypothetical protein
MPIFVDIDNSDGNDKRFNAANTGKAAAKAEEAMQKAAKESLTGNAKFTTSKPKNPKGYEITLTVTKVVFDKDKNTTKCFVSGVIARVPLQDTKSGAKGTDMLSGGWTGSGTVGGGTSDDDVVFCVGGVVKDMMKKDGIPAMEKDFAERK